MAQAYRSKLQTSRTPASGHVRVTGCYNLDHKVAVEWELDLNKKLVRDIISELPDGELEFRIVRASFSASCLDRQEERPTGIITNFRLNRQSTLGLLEAGAKRSLLRVISAADPIEDGCWRKL